MDLAPIIIVPTIFYFTYKIFDSLIRKKERIMLLEKLDVSNLRELPSEEALNVLNYLPNKRFSGLRSGLLIVGIGFGLLVAWTLMTIVYVEFESYIKESYRFREMLNIIYLAAPALFGGIGLVISYVIERNQKS